MKSMIEMFKALPGTILVLAFALVGEAAAQTWTPLAPSGGPPVARMLHTAVYNQTTNRMIVFGGFKGDPDSGFCGPDCTNDVWVLTNADGTGGSPAWTQLSPTGSPPSTRGYHSAVYDALSNRMIVYGGDPQIGFCFGAVNDTWVLTNADGTGGPPAWIQLFPTAGPAPDLRQGPTAVYDSVSNRMVVFGGRVNACQPLSNNVWVLTNANGLTGTPAWTQLSPTGSLPAARQGHNAVYDTAYNRMIVFGGTTTGVNNDVWVLSNANGLGGTPAWTQLSPTGGPPAARSSSSAVYDQATSRMVVFGGSTAAGLPNDVWELTNAKGSSERPSGLSASQPGGHRLREVTIPQSSTQRPTG